MKLTSSLHVVLASLILTINSCKKNDNKDAQLITHTFSVESIVAPGDNQSTTNKCFINLYDGLAYTKAEAELQSSKVDFAYNYHGGGCSSCRFFENVNFMSSRTFYVESFSTITQSIMAEAELRYQVSVADFDAIRTAGDIDKIFDESSFILGGSGDITNRTTDAAVNRVFAFKDKDGRKGFFKVGDYVANVPDGDKATLELTVKIQE